MLARWKKIFRKNTVSQLERHCLESAMRHVDILDRHNFHEFKVSVKASNVFSDVGRLSFIVSAD
jgi:4-hydroxy-3-methylbut-2-en-1-yl diphosphate synthase IspG/GcpE